MDVIAMQMQYAHARVMESLRSFRDEESGQGLVEYALILGLVAVVAAAFLTGLANAIGDLFNEIIKKLGGTEVT